MITKNKAIQRNIQTLMRERRIALGIKQSEIAEISGVKTRMLQKFEQTGEITLTNLCKLFVAYKIDEKLNPFFRDKSWWSLEEIKRAETKKTVRSPKKKGTNIWVIPIDDAKFGTFTQDKKYQVLHSESVISEVMGDEESVTDKSFMIKDDDGKELLMTSTYCKEIIEDE